MDGQKGSHGKLQLELLHWSSLPQMLLMNEILLIRQIVPLFKSQNRLLHLKPQTRTNVLSYALKSGQYMDWPCLIYSDTFGVCTLGLILHWVQKHSQWTHLLLDLVVLPSWRQKDPSLRRMAVKWKFHGAVGCDSLSIIKIWPKGIVIVQKPHPPSFWSS